MLQTWCLWLFQHLPAMNKHLLKNERIFFLHSQASWYHQMVFWNSSRVWFWSTVNCLQWHKQGPTWARAGGGELSNAFVGLFHTPPHQLDEVFFSERLQRADYTKTAKQVWMEAGKKLCGYFHLLQRQFLKQIGFIPCIILLEARVVTLTKPLLEARLKNLTDLRFRKPWKIAQELIFMPSSYSSPASLFKATTKKGLHYEKCGISFVEGARMQVVGFGEPKYFPPHPLPKDAEPSVIYRGQRDESCCASQGKRVTAESLGASKLQ